MSPQFLHCYQGKVQLPESILPDLWTYQLYTDPLSCRILVLQSSEGYPAAERILDLRSALHSLPVELDGRIELLADLGEMLVLRPHGEIRKSIKFDDTLFYQL